MIAHCPKSTFICCYSKPTKANFYTSCPTMYKIVLMRHGESTWNLDNRFTGWTDVDLTEKGISEARHAGKL